MNSFPIVDTHAHFLEEESAERPHDLQAKQSPTSFKMAPLSYDELAAHAADAGVNFVVQVTTSTVGYDNRYSFEGVRARPDRYLGVVCRVDPFAADVEEQLSALAGQPDCLGVRLTLAHEWSMAWLGEGKLDAFFGIAGRMGTPVYVFAPFRNAEVADIAREHPDLRLVVDHMGVRYLPGLTADTAFRDWTNLARLAALPNVWIKVSHFPEAVMASEQYPYPTARDRFRQLYEAVGAARLLWGSNYPPVLRACSYAQAVDFVRVECDFLSDPDRAAIMGGNFIRDFCPGRLPASSGNR